MTLISLGEWLCLEINRGDIRSMGVMVESRQPTSVSSSQPPGMVGRKIRLRNNP